MPTSNPSAAPPRRRRIFARPTSRREWLLFALPAALAIAAAFWVTTRFVKPAPPSTLTMTTGSAEGAYHTFAQKYREILARDGITLELKASVGSVDNLARLKDDKAGIEVGFVQGGLGMLSLTPLAQPPEETKLYALANLFHEPIWVFYRAKADITRLDQLEQSRIAVGQPGSGTRKVALELLAAHGIAEKAPGISNLAGSAAADALLAGSLDAMFVIAAPEAPIVKRLIEAEGVKLMSFANAQAMSRRFPYLRPVTLAHGVFDLKANRPPRDVQLLASEANLVIREDLHPALAYLLLEAAVEVHGTPGLFHQPGEFPTPLATDWPLADEAKRYFKTGRPFLQRYLPFWAANLVERMLVLLVPLFAVVVPLAKFLPELFSWRQRSKINRWYGELKYLEFDAEAGAIVGAERGKALERLDEIEGDAAALSIPLAYADRLYTLRLHIDYVRARLSTAVEPAP